MARPVCLHWQRFSIPHSSVIFSTVTSGNPPCRGALSPSLSLTFLLSFFLSLATSLLLSLFLFLSLPLYLFLRPLFISELGKSSVTPPLSPPSSQFIFPPSFSLKVSPQVSSPIFFDRGPLTRHLSQCSKFEHTSCCCHREFTTLHTVPVT